MKTVDVLNAYIEEGEEEDEGNQEQGMQNAESGGLTLQVPSMMPVPEVKVTNHESEITTSTSEISAPAHGHSHNVSSSVSV